MQQAASKGYAVCVEERLGWLMPVLWLRGDRPSTLVGKWSTCVCLYVSGVGEVSSVESSVSRDCMLRVQERLFEKASCVSRGCTLLCASGFVYSVSGAIVGDSCCCESNGERCGTWEAPEL